MRWSTGFAIMTLWLAVGCHEAAGSRLGPETQLQFVHDRTRDLSRLGHYARAVKLESSPEAILGNINEIKLVPGSGDLLVADFRVTKKIYRFNGEGRFIRSYGKVGQGPGEYQGLMGFAPMDDGRIVVLSTFKMMIYAEDGSYLDGIQVQIAPHGVQTHGDRIYVHAISGRKDITKAVHVFNDQLEKVGEFHPYDRRINDLPFIPRHSLAKGRNGLIVSESYDFLLAAYDWDGHPMNVWRFPADNASLDPYWRKLKRSSLDLKDKQAFFNELHRPMYTFAMGDLVYLFEIQNSQDIRRSCLLDTATATVTVFHDLSLVSEENQPLYLTMDGLAGCYEHGVIGFLEDPARLEAHRASVPVLADLTLDQSENPIVLFFEISAPRVADM